MGPTEGPSATFAIGRPTVNLRVERDSDEAICRNVLGRSAALWRIGARTERTPDEWSGRDFPVSDLLQMVRRISQGEREYQHQLCIDRFRCGNPAGHGRYR